MLKYGPMRPVILLILALSAFDARAYLEHDHYYTTYTIAEWCGLPDAEPIAWANYAVDILPENSPGVNAYDDFPKYIGELFRTMGDKFEHFKTKIYDRILFHYALNPGEDTVKRDSKSSRALIEKAFLTDPLDPVLLGIGLHRYQDSWSHEGFGVLWGHTAELYSVDEPENDVPKALEMAEGTWKVLDQWSRLKTGVGCKTGWDQIRPKLKLWYENPNGDRAFTWKERVFLNFGKEIDPEPVEENSSLPHFRELIQDIKDLKINIFL